MEYFLIPLFTGEAAEGLPEELFPFIMQTHAAVKAKFFDVSIRAGTEVYQPSEHALWVYRESEIVRKEEKEMGDIVGANWQKIPGPKFL